MMTQISIRMNRMLAALVLLVGLVGCASEPATAEGDDVALGESQAALLTGDFQYSCGHVFITNNTLLEADCADRNGHAAWRKVDLNMGIANANGHLVWRQWGGLGGSCRNCRIPANAIWGWDDVTFSCLCRNQRGEEDWSSINLAEQISNQNGVLDFDFF